MENDSSGNSPDTAPNTKAEGWNMHQDQAGTIEVAETPPSAQTYPEAVSIRKPSSLLAKVSVILLVLVGLAIGYIAGIFMVFMSGCWAFKGPQPACANVMGFAPFAMAVASLLFTVPVASKVFSRGSADQKSPKATQKKAIYAGIALILLFVFLALFYAGRQSF